MSPRRVNPELAQKRRDALIKAAYAEILEKGIDEVTLDSVVARAGFSKGGALYYFPAKEDLLCAVLEWLLSQMSHTLDEVVHSPSSPRNRLVSQLEVLFHSAEVNRCFYRVFYDFVALSGKTERIRRLLVQFYDGCRRRNVALIEEGIKQQQFRRVNPVAAATTIRALVDGYCLQWLTEESAAPLEEYRDRARAVLGGFLLR